MENVRTLSDSSRWNLFCWDIALPPVFGRTHPTLAIFLDPPCVKIGAVIGLFAVRHFHVLIWLHFKICLAYRAIWWIEWIETFRVLVWIRKFDHVNHHCNWALFPYSLHPLNNRKLLFSLTFPLFHYPIFANYERDSQTGRGEKSVFFYL